MVTPARGRSRPLTPRRPHTALSPAAELPVTRVVALVLVLLALSAVVLVVNVARQAPAPSDAPQVTSLDPRTLFGDNTSHFLPTPVAALPPEANAGPPPPAPDEQQPPAPERVKIANTGGAGAILRAEPPRGKQVTALRDGTLLQVIDHQTLPDGSEWLHVRTPDGVEGWVFSKLTAPAE